MQIDEAGRCGPSWFWKGSVWIPCLIGGVVLSSPGCGPATSAAVEMSAGEPAATPARVRPVPAGHRRMLALLERVATEGLESNPGTGMRTVPALRADLAGLSDDQPDLRRWLFNKLLGKQELRLGHPEPAIQHYEEARRELEVFKDEIPHQEAMQTVLELGVAYLNLGETQNWITPHEAGCCALPIERVGVHALKDASQNAARCFTDVLKGTPADSWPHLKARWLLNLAYMTLGSYPDGVPEAYLIPPAAFRSDENWPRFNDIAPRLGLDSFDGAGGALAEDLDRDGFLDIMVSTGDISGQLRYYRNNGDGSFTERTAEAGLTGLYGGLNLTHADYDNDGDSDVMVLRGAWWREFGRHPNSLIRNNGDGTFTDVSFEAGLGEAHYPTQTAAWADYDNDGDLDLYVGNETDANVRAPCQLFRNDGDGTFTDVARRAGVENLRYAKAVAWGDYDGDRFPDLYVSNMGHRNRLYHNNGDGTFTDVASRLGVTRPIAAFPAWFWDFDNDGALDLFVAAYGGPKQGADVADVAAGYLGMAPRAELDRLYRGDGRGGFEEVAVEHNLTRVTFPMGANFGDPDNDGFPDFYLGTGYPYYEALMPNLMFHNLGGSGFSDVTTSGGFGLLQKGHGVVFADLDHDGDQDVFEQTGGMNAGDKFYNVLFENPGFGNHWIKIELIGTRSNRAGIGARIRIEANERGTRRTIYKHVNTGGSFGANPLRQEVGLGRASNIDLLEIYWPTSDLTQRFRNVAADQRIEVTEGRDAYTKLPLERISFGSRDE